MVNQIEVNKGLIPVPANVVRSGAPEMQSVSLRDSPLLNPFKS